MSYVLYSQSINFLWQKFDFLMSYLCCQNVVVKAMQQEIDNFIKKHPIPKNEKVRFDYFNLFRIKLKIKSDNILDYLPLSNGVFSEETKDIFTNLLNVLLVYKGARPGALIDGYYFNGYTVLFAKLLDPQQCLILYDEDDEGNIYFWNIKKLGLGNILNSCTVDFVNVNSDEISTFIKNNQFLQRNLYNSSFDVMYSLVKEKKSRNNIKALALGYFTRDYLWPYEKNSKISVYEITTDTVVFTEIFNPIQVTKVTKFYSDKIKQFMDLTKEYFFEFTLRIEM
jgi:hypothetical protein